MHQAVPVKHMELIDGEANEAVFDYSGQYLACAGGKGVVVYHTKVPQSCRRPRCLVLSCPLRYPRLICTRF